MYENNVVGVVVPAYNEEGLVGEVLETLPASVDRAYVVDDDSTDGTWEEILSTAERLNERVPEDAHFRDRIYPLQHDRNRGVGGAIKTGYQYALKDDVDLIAVMGGDGQMDPDELPRLLDPVAEGVADYAKGNRLARREYREGMSAWREFGNWLLTALTKIASGYWTTMDPQNGYTVISAAALRTIELDEMYEGYGYCNDLLVKLNASGLRVADVPQPARYGDEESSIRYHTYIPSVSLMLLRNFLWRLRVKYLVREFHPLALLYVLGAPAALGSALLALRDRLTGREREREVDGTASRLTVFLLGWLAMFLAMIFDREANADAEIRIDE